MSADYEQNVTVTYSAPGKNSGASITFDPPNGSDEWNVPNGKSKNFTLTRVGDDFKFRALTFWAEVNQSVAQTFADGDNEETKQFPNGQIISIDTDSTSQVSFTVKNTSRAGEDLTINMEVTIEDNGSGARWTSRDPQIPLEKPVGT